jgi:hypothetical protein
MPKLELPEGFMPKLELPEGFMPKLELPEGFMPKLELPEHLVGKVPDSFTRWLDSAVPRVDMAAWSNVVGTASAVAPYMYDAVSAAAHRLIDMGRSYRALEDRVTPALRSVYSAVGALDGVLTPALQSLYSRIDEVARLTPGIQLAAEMWATRVNDLMQSWAVLSRFGHRLAGKALHLALTVRDALVNNPDRSAVRTAVIDFMRRVLGYTGHPTDARIEAVTSALLDDAWLPPVESAFDADYNPADPLREIVIYQHGLWLPLSEIRPRGQRILSLEKPSGVSLGSGEDSPPRLMDGLQSADFTPEQQPITHPVLKRLMDPLTPIEREIVWARHYDGARTWADAATMCGRPTREGETVRRKFLKLKNAERQRRSA